MTWAKELEELRAREALAEQMGGADKVARQHGRGKMDALDPSGRSPREKSPR